MAKSLSKPAIKKEIITIYNKTGWNGVRAYLKRNNIPHSFTIYEFGLSTNKSVESAKQDWLKSETAKNLRRHYYNRSVKSKGWTYNVVRGQQVELI